MPDLTLEQIDDELTRSEALVCDGELSRVGWKYVRLPDLLAAQQAAATAAGETDGETK